MPIDFKKPQFFKEFRFGPTLIWSVINDILTTVTGVSPLSLVNALAKPIKHLIQYGKLSVSGSTITCNNGELKVVDNEIVADGTPEVVTLSASGAADQTATAENLFAVDDIADEQDIITGKVIRRTEAVVSDGTTPSGRYVGEVSDGNIIVKARETGYSGEIVSFTTEEETPLNGLRVNFEPIQDLHGYDNPWPSGGGVQKIDPDWLITSAVSVNDVTATPNGDGTFTLSGTASATTYLNLFTPDVYMNLSDMGIFEAGQSYKLSGGKSGNIAMFFGIYGSGTDYVDAGSGATMNFTQEVIDAKQYRLSIRVLSGVDTNGVVVKPMIEKGSTVSAWQPYSNICPISGHTDADVTRTGKNLLGSDTLYAENTLYSVSGSPSANSNFDSYRIKAVANQAVSLSGIPADTNFIYRVLMFNSAMSFVSSLANNISGTAGTRKTATVTPSSDGWIIVCARKNVTDKQVELGSTASDYEEYRGTTYPIPLGQTVYGGTLDVLTGVLTVTMAIVDMGTLTWRKLRDSIFYATPTGVVVSDTWYGLCSQYQCRSDIGLTSLQNCCWTSRAGAHECYVRDDNYTVADDFKNAVDGVQLVYPLATPIVYQLSPQAIETLRGLNNVWGSGKSVNVYVSDGELIVQVTPQKLKTAEGDNTLTVTAEVENIVFDVTYRENNSGE